MRQRNRHRQSRRHPGKGLLHRQEREYAGHARRQQWRHILFFFKGRYGSQLFIWYTDGGDQCAQWMRFDGYQCDGHGGRWVCVNKLENKHICINLCTDVICNFNTFLIMTLSFEKKKKKTFYFSLWRNSYSCVCPKRQLEIKIRWSILKKNTLSFWKSFITTLIGF